jgi:hypothetical protein
VLDRLVRVYKDLLLGERGYEGDPVVVELPEGTGTFDDVEVLMCTIPPEDQDWIIKGQSLPECSPLVLP